VRIVVDLSRCQGYANCVGVAPELFDLDPETGQAVVLQADPSPDQQDPARQAAAGCPVQAILVEDN
jgi:ferredoxin